MLIDSQNHTQLAQLDALGPLRRHVSSLVMHLFDSVQAIPPRNKDILPFSYTNWLIFQFLSAADAH